MYVAKERLYINGDRTKVVAENSPEVAFLLAPEGGEISEREARKYGLIPEEVPTSAPSPTKISERTTRVPKNLTER